MHDIFRKHWLFMLPLVVFASYYLPQNLIGFDRSPIEPIMALITALLVSTLSYVFAYRWLPVGWADRLAAALKVPQRPGSTMVIILSLYVLTLGMICSAAEQVPLLASLKGASAEQLADYRNSFMRGQTGDAGLYNYSYAILSQALMPLVIAHAFWEGKRWRHAVLAVFILGTSLSLSKGAFLCVASPLLAVWLMRAQWKNLAITVLAFLLSVAMMYVLASGKLATLYPSQQPPEAARVVLPGAAMPIVTGRQLLLPGSTSPALPLLAHWNALIGLEQRSQEPQSPPTLLSDVPEHYSLFGRESQLGLIANRILWIPYITAVDWFRYHQDELQGEYVLGRSIRPLAWLLGVEQIHLEREVAELQWGGPSGATSNAVFFADAWLNWGVLGVALYSMLLALTIKLIVTSGNPALMAASAFPVWIACFSALPPVYLSAGLGFLLLFALLARKPVKDAVP